MTAANREACFKHVGAAEGGFSNRSRKADPGGPTNFGVTAATLGAWRGLGREATAAEVKAMNRDEAVEIYAAQYWRPCGADKLPDGLDLAVFDFAINSGPGKAVEYLQRVVGAPVDRSFGAITLERAMERPLSLTIEELCDARLAYMKRLKNWADNKNGWSTRVAHIRATALAMAANVKPPAPLKQAASAAAKAPPTAEVASKTPAGKGSIIAAGTGAAVTLEATTKVVSKSADIIAPRAADSSFIGTAAVVILALIMLAGLAVVLYQVHRRREEQKGKKLPPTLLGWLNMTLSGYGPEGRPT
jgi:lysozyme family protein